MKYFVEIILALTFVLLCFLVGFTIGYAIYSGSSPEPRTEMPIMDMSQVENPKYSPIVKLLDKKTGAFFCSGSVISKNYVLTAGHCLEGRSKTKVSIEIRDMNGEKTGASGTAAFYEEMSDQGLVLGDFSEFNVVSFTPNTMKITQSLLDPAGLVVVCGFPYGGELFCDAFANRRQYQFGYAGDGLLYPGMSGGPVLDMATGVVVGVNTAVMEPGIYISPLIELLTNAHVRLE